MKTSTPSRAALALLVGLSEAAGESIHLTTYYPAPSGVYNQMITTNNTWLARDGGRVGIGTPNPQAKLHISGGDLQWGDNLLTTDQGGSIELGGSNTAPGAGAPYIDFHFNGLTEDFNARIINDSDKRLSIVSDAAVAGIAYFNGWSGGSEQIAVGENDVWKNAGDPTLSIQYNRPGGKVAIGGAAGATNDLEVNGGAYVRDRLGIGTAAPQAPLDVAGAVKVGSLPADPTGADGMVYYNTAVGDFRGFKNGAWGPFSARPRLESKWAGFCDPNQGWINTQLEDDMDSVHQLPEDSWTGSGKQYLCLRLVF